MGRKRMELHEYGKRFGKSDLDRIGFFHDPSPAPFDSYRGHPVEFRDGIEKGRQMLSGPPGKLFEKKFVRIFEREALTEPWRTKVEERFQRGRTKIVGPMLPPSPSKKHSTPGDWHGCFEKPSYLSPELRKPAKKTKIENELPNVKIKPNPLGGPGYVNICINPYPSYSHDPYDPIKSSKPDKQLAGRFLSAATPLDHFPPNPYENKDPGPTYVRPIESTRKMMGTGRFYVPFPKKAGGNHDGCFDKYPAYRSDPYIKIKEEVEAEARFVTAAPSSRSKYTNSIIEQVTKRSCNLNNYLNYKEKAYPLNY